MQSRLDSFFSFDSNESEHPTQKKASRFNPFHSEIQETITEQRKITDDILEILKPDRVLPPPKLENVLDAPPGAPPVLALFPTKPETVPIASQDTFTEMIQPRDKEGGRKLYAWPNIPRVGAKGAYYLLVGQSDRSEAAWLLQFDGAANPNPGPASSGAVLWSPKDLDGKRHVVFEMGKYLGRATNNIAEAQGILLGLKIAAMRGARELLIEGDSELIVFQHIRRYQVKDKNIKVWWSEAQAAMMDESCFDWIAIRQVPREFNERADSITKEVLSKKEGFQR
jgi:ribonuclease HI